MAHFKLGQTLCPRPDRGKADPICARALEQCRWGMDDTGRCTARKQWQMVMGWSRSHTWPRHVSVGGTAFPNPSVSSVAWLAGRGGNGSTARLGRAGPASASISSAVSGSPALTAALQAIISSTVVHEGIGIRTRAPCSPRISSRSRTKGLLRLTRRSSQQRRKALYRDALWPNRCELDPDLIEQFSVIFEHFHAIGRHAEDLGQERTL
jgi:hypothetical protein